MHPLLTDIDDFLGNMAEVVKDNPRRILFATYRCVTGVDDGVQNPKDGLTIGVQNGYFDPMSLEMSLVLMVAPHSVQDAIIDAAKEEARGIFENEVEKVDASGYQLAFVYVGVSQFEKPLAFAKKLGREMVVYVVSCDCNLDADHQPVLAEAIERHEVRGVVVAPECGAEDAMRAIYDRIVALS